jgi:hypothetical protein
MKCEMAIMNLPRPIPIRCLWLTAIDVSKEGCEWDEKNLEHCDVKQQPQVFTTCSTSAVAEDDRIKNRISHQEVKFEPCHWQELKLQHTPSPQETTRDSTMATHDDQCTFDAIRHMSALSCKVSMNAFLFLKLLFCGCITGHSIESEESTCQICLACGAEWPAFEMDENTPKTIEWCMLDGKYCDDGIDCLMNAYANGINLQEDEKWIAHCRFCFGCRYASFTPIKWKFVLAELENPSR